MMRLVLRLIYLHYQAPPGSSGRDFWTLLQNIHLFSTQSDRQLSRMWRTASAPLLHLFIQSSVCHSGCTAAPLRLCEQSVAGTRTTVMSGSTGRPWRKNVSQQNQFHFCEPILSLTPSGTAGSAFWTPAQRFSFFIFFSRSLIVLQFSTELFLLHDESLTTAWIYDVHNDFPFFPHFPPFFMTRVKKKTERHQSVFLS